MLKTALFTLATAGLTLMANGQKTLKKLEKQLTEACANFGGNIGYTIISLKTGKVASFHADTVFPTASIVKIPIMLGVVDQMMKGNLGYHQPLVYRDSLLYEGDDILGSFKDQEKIELSKVLMLMLTTSDNTASLWLQTLGGGGLHINQLLAKAGFVHTRVNSRTLQRDSARRQYGWGQTTPGEMARLMQQLVKKQWFSDSASSAMLKMLSRNIWDEEALSAIPAGVFVASKNGAVNASRSEVLYVNGRHPYIFSVFTKNNIDQRWDADNAAWVLTRKLSTMAWQYFNP
jgi:beta-lactamase class A